MSVEKVQKARSKTDDGRSLNESDPSTSNENRLVAKSHSGTGDRSPLTESVFDESNEIPPDAYEPADHDPLNESPSAAHDESVEPLNISMILLKRTYVNKITAPKASQVIAPKMTAPVEATTTKAQQQVLVPIFQQSKYNLRNRK